METLEEQESLALLMGGSSVYLWASRHHGCACVFSPLSLKVFVPAAVTDRLV